MDHTGYENLDAVILEEKRLVAEQHALEAIEAALQDGIELPIIVRALIKEALTELTGFQGHEATSQLVSEISNEQLSGAFVADRVIQ